MIDDTASPQATLSAGMSTYVDAMGDLDALAASQRRLNLELVAASQLGRQFGRTLSAAFVGLAVQGKSFGDVLSSLALGLSRIALGAAFKPLESAFGSALQSLLAAPSPVSSSGLAMPAVLAAASGASMSATEMRATQAITSAGAVSAAGMSPSIVVNVTTPDADSFRRSETQVAAVLARAVGLGQRNL